MVKRVSWKRKAVPIFLHGDDVLVVRVGKLGIASLSNCSWQPLLTRGRSLYIKRLIFGIFRQNLALGTEARYWHMITWSLMSLFRGIHPDEDWDRQEWPVGSSERLLGERQEPLTGGYFFVVWGLQNDLDYGAKVFNMKNYNSVAPCDFCPCHKHSPDPKMKPTYFGRDATWMRMLHTPREWRRLNLGMHDLFTKFAFLSAVNIEPDEMHILYLGICQYHLGSILWLLVFRLMPSTAENNMRALWSGIMLEYASGTHNIRRSV